MVVIDPRLQARWRRFEGRPRTTLAPVQVSGSPFPPWSMAISLQELELHLYRLRPARPERRSPELAPSPENRCTVSGPWAMGASHRRASWAVLLTLIHMRMVQFSNTYGNLSYNYGENLIPIVVCQIFLYVGASTPTNERSLATG